MAKAKVKVKERLQQLISMRRTSGDPKRGLFSAAFALLIIFLLVAWVYTNKAGNATVYATIENGVLDLSAWNPEQKKPLRLAGEWEFYPDRLLDQASLGTAGSPAIVRTPHLWDNRSPYGFATYRLHIRNAPVDFKLAVKIGMTPISYQMYANHELVIRHGTLGADQTTGANATDGEATALRNRPLTASFLAPARDFDLIVHVANAHYPFGGLWASLQLGSEQAMLRFNTGIVQKEAIAFGALFIMALYYSSFYLAIRRDRVSLLFAVGCLLMMLRIALHGDRTLLLPLPELSFQTLFMLTHWIDVWTPLPFLLIIHFLFLQESSSWPIRIYAACAGTYSVMLPLLPLDMIIRFSSFMHIAVLLVIGASCATVVFAVKRRRAGALPNLIGFFLLTVSVLHDIIFALTLRVSPLGELAQAGVAAFLAAQAFLLAQRYLNAHLEAEKLSQELLVLNRHKDEFLAHTSHELKTPLNGMIGLTDSLKAGVAGTPNDEQLHHLDLIARSGRRLRHLIEDLLVYSQIKHDKIELFPVHLKLDGIMKPIVDIHRHLIGDKPIGLVCLLPEPLSVFADENRLIQILHNLIGNAVKYTNAGTITVTARRLDDGWIELAVHDTGIGIPPDKLHMIFESFEQVDKSAARIYGGIGLGLPISKHLIELHGGTINVESSPGAGSTFRFTLPAGSSREASDAAYFSGGEAVAAGFSAETLPAAQEVLQLHGYDRYEVVVVDDDPVHLQVLVNFLTLDGYSLKATTDSSKAWQMIEERGEQLALVVMDLMMPHLSGYELCRMIRERWTEVELPVLMMTADGQQQTMLTGFEAGANDYLTKPFEAEEFRARVRTLMQIKGTMTKVKEIELAFLQAQIKPHFLYNTLNTIATICMKNPVQARDLIGDLATYLRQSFHVRHLEQFVTLETEMELVEAYLHIEQARFGERLNVVYRIDPAMALVPIPPLTIQPLAENAVRHGVMTKSAGGTVHIEVKQVAGCCLICVSDDGAGMTDEARRALFASPAVQTAGTGKAGIGLINIHTRLRKLFGTGLTVHANDPGTTVSFQIPL